MIVFGFSCRRWVEQCNLIILPSSHERPLYPLVHSQENPFPDSDTEQRPLFKQGLGLQKSFVSSQLSPDLCSSQTHITPPPSFSTQVPLPLHVWSSHSLISSCKTRIMKVFMTQRLTMIIISCNMTWFNWKCFYIASSDHTVENTSFSFFMSITHIIILDDVPPPYWIVDNSGLSK